MQDNDQLRKPRTSKKRPKKPATKRSKRKASGRRTTKRKQAKKKAERKRDGTVNARTRITVCSNCSTPKRDPDQEHPGICVCGGYLTDPEVKSPDATATVPRADGRAITGKAHVGVEVQQAAFLEAFSRIGVITTAAEMAGVDRQRHYEWLTDLGDDGLLKYPDYQDRFDEARKRAIDRIERAVIERGVYGYDEPVFGNKVDSKTGRSLGTHQIGTRRVFSDRMLELATKRHIPEYREKTAIEHTGAGGGPIQTVTANLSIDEIEARLAKAFDVIRASKEPAALPAPTTIDVKPVSDDPVEAAKRAYAAEVEARKNGH